MTHELCSCNNCNQPVLAKNLCSTHYKRLQRHGTTEQTRSPDWGMKEKHPLYHSWGWMKKMRGRHTIQPEWDDFWEYVKDIGDKPSPQHRLKKVDESLGYTRGNLVWVETLPTTSNRNEYAKRWRKLNPNSAKNSDLKRFGITLEMYNNMLQEQNNSCAICGKHESEEHQNLSVDHCHTTGKVRGLLCSHCNTGLGLFKDNIDNLQKAIKYLNL